jgi:hypothetical protein
VLAYGLCDIIDDYRAVRVPVVHRCQALVSLLPCGIPYLELDGGLIIESYSLCEEGGADGGFAVVIELVLDMVSSCTRHVMLESHIIP